MEIRHKGWVSSLPRIFDVARVMKEGRSKEPEMVRGLFRSLLRKRSSLFLEYLNFLYKPCQEQNAVKPFAILIIVVQRQDGISLGGEAVLCSFPGNSLEGSFSDLGGHLLPTVSVEYGG